MEGPISYNRDRESVGALYAPPVGQASGENDYEDFLYQNANSSVYNKKHNIAIKTEMA